MPRDFGGILREHRMVREDAGVFDLSHMGRLVLKGPGIVSTFQKLFTRRLEHLQPGIARYGFLCDSGGGCIDDIIVYLRSEQECWLVVNAANRETVVSWIREHLPRESLQDRTDESALLAIQGPNAGEWFDRLGLPLLPGDPFHSTWESSTMVATTGYTGEAGGECWTTIERARDVFEQALQEGLEPCGLGARDTLRLEKGYPLHGHELNEEIDPITAGLEIFVDDHDFIGRDALQRINQMQSRPRILGVKTDSRRSPRQDQVVRDDDNRVGTITSGRYSPTLETGIGLCLFDEQVLAGDSVSIQQRNQSIPATVETPPFV
mgnify:CR=1 FL=1